MTSTFDTGADTRVRNLAVSATGGQGFIDMIPQSVKPTGTANLMVYADSNNRMTWAASGRSATMNTSGLTADRIWSLPDMSDSITTTNTTETFRNKTILSADNNIVEANRLLGNTVTGVAATNNLLVFDGLTWKPLTVSATAPATYSNGQIGVSVGSTAGTVAAGNDGRLITPQRVVVKSGSAGAGEFTSIAAALASILDAAPTKPYIVVIYPGLYFEPTLVVAPWISLVGPSLGTSVTIVPLGSPAVNMASNSIIYGITLNGQGSGIGVQTDSTDGAFVQDCVIRGFAKCTYVTATTAPTTFAVINSFAGAFTYAAIHADGRLATGIYPIDIAVNTNRVTSDNTASHVYRFEGPNVSALVYTIDINGALNGNALHIEDGANVEFSFSRIKNCRNGVVVANVGSAPNIRLTSLSIVECLVRDISVEHPGTTGIFTGIADRTKVYADPAANTTMNFSDRNGGTTITGGLFYSPTASNITEIGRQITYTTSLGIYAGGAITITTGRELSISAGEGYISVGSYPDEYLKLITWVTSTITIPADTTAYIFIDDNGVQFALSTPDPLHTLLIGRVRTTTTGFEFIDPQRVGNLHPVNQRLIAEKKTTGPLYSNGSLTSQSGFNLNVSSGQYYYLDNEYNLVGGTPIVWLQYYHVGGVWTITQTGTVNNSQYDNMTDLVALPAGKFVKHLLYTVGTGANEKYLLVIGQTAFDTLFLATEGEIAMTPNYFNEGVILIACVIAQQGSSVLTIIDGRPRVGGSTVGQSSVSGNDHGDLSGLLDDDHPQYLLTNGSRSMGGQLDMGGNNIDSVNNINGFNINTHGSRHLPNGADPIASAAAVMLTATTVNGVGTANSFARSDHTHAIDFTSASINALNGIANVAHGGTGLGTLTSGNVLVGNGTSPVTLTPAPVGLIVGTTDTQLLTNKSVQDTTFAVVDSADNTRQIRFDAAGTTATSTTILGSQTANRVLTLPDTSDTLVARTTMDTLTNKTIVGATNNVDANALKTTGTSVNVAGSTPPTTGQTLVATSATTATWQTPTSTYIDTAFRVTDALDTSKALLIDVTGAASTATTIVTTQTANRSLTLPNITDTLVTKNTTDTLTNKTVVGGSLGNDIAANRIYTVVLSNTAPVVGQALIATGTSAAQWANVSLTDVSGVLSVANGGTGASTLVAGNVLVGNGTGVVSTAKVAPAGAFVGTSDTQILTNKSVQDATFAVIDSVDSTRQIRFDAAGTTSTSTTILGSQTANRVLTLPDASDTLVGRATTDILTNKNITGNTNTVEASSLRTVGAPVLLTGVVTPTVGQVLTATTTTTAAWQTPSTSFVDTTFAIVDSADNTRQIRFDAAGTTSTSTTILSSQTANRVLTLPNATDTLVGRTTTDTLTNKTLTQPVISQIVNTGTLTLPTTTDTLVGRNTSDTLTNKSMSDTTFAVVDSVDPTKQLRFDVNGNTASATTIQTTQTSARLIILPDANDTLVGKSTVDTLINKTIVGGASGNDISANKVLGTSVTNTPTTGQLLVATSGTASEWSQPSINGFAGVLSVTSGGTGAGTLTSGNVLVGAGNAAVTTNKAAPVGTFVGTTDVQVLTNKSVHDNTFSIVDASDATIQIRFDAVGTTATSTTLQSSQTVNRTLTLPDATDTLVGRATSDTLSNKIITGATNIVEASALRTVGAAVVLSGAATPSVGHVLTANTTTTANWQAPATSFVDTTFAVVDSVDNTRQVRFDAAGTTATSTTLQSSQTANRVLTLPNATDTLVGRATTDTLTNKTLTQPVISQIVNTGTLTLPTSTDTLVGRNTTDILTNKSVQDTTFAVVDSVDPTKRILFNAEGVTTTSTTLQSSQTTNRTLTLPDASDTLVARATTDTLTNKTIVGGASGNDVAANRVYAVTLSNTAPTSGQALIASGTNNASWQTINLGAASGIVPASNGGTGVNTLTSGNVLVGNGTGAVQTTKAAPSGDFVGTTDTQLLTNKSVQDTTFAVVDSLDNTRQIRFDAAGTTSTSTTILSSQTANRVLTLPDTSDTLVGLSATQTLTNKTLTAPVISQIVNTGTLTLPTTTDTIVGRNTTDVLANKSMSDATFSVVDSADNTKQLRFDVNGTGSTSTTLQSAQTANRVLMLPDTNDTLIGRTTVDTIENKTIVGGTVGNDVAANRLHTVVVSNVAPTTNQLLTAINGTNAQWQSLNVSNATGTLPVAQGGTGATSLTSGNFLVGNGTSAVQTTKVAPAGVVVGTTDTQTLENKSVVDATFAVVDSVDASIKITFNSAGTSSTNTTIATASTANRVLTLPDATDTLVGKATTDSLSNKTIVGGISGNDVSANRVRAVVVSASAPTTGQLLIADSATTASWQSLDLNTFTGNLTVPQGGTGVGTLTSGNVLVGNGTGAVLTTKAAPAGAFVGTTDTQLLTNKSVQDTTFAVVDLADNTRQIRFDAAGTTATSTILQSSQTTNVTVTLPNATDTLVGRTTTDTLTNKTLTQPTIAQINNGGLLTLPTGVDTLVGLAATQTLTNKTVIGGTSGNVIAANRIHAVTLSNTAPTTGQILTATSATTAQWQALDASSFVGIVSVSQGGTGVGTLTSGNFLVGDGTSAVQTTKVAPAGIVVGTTDTQTMTNKSLEDNSTFIVSNTDATRRIVFDAEGSTGTTTTIVTTSTVNRTLTLPNVTDTLIGRTTTDTLTNKTLTQPIIAQIVNTGTLTLPTITDTLVGRNTTDVLANKSVQDTTFAVVDSLDNTRQIRFDAAGTTATSTTLQSSQTTNRVLTLPDVTDNLVARSTTDTLTNKTIVGGSTGNDIAANRIYTVVLSNTAPTSGQLLTASSGIAASWQSPNFSSFGGTVNVSQGGTGVTNLTSGNVLVGNGTGAVLTTKVAPTGAFVGTTDTQLLTNKSVHDNTFAIVDAGDITRRITFDAGGNTGTTTTFVSSQTVNRNIIIPDISDQLVTRNTVDTLTNKTLTQPIISQIINTGTLTLPTATDTLVGRATTDTLTNKTLTLPTIAQINNGGTLTLPTGPDTLVGLNSTQLLTNKSMSDSTFAVVDNADASKRIIFDVNGQPGSVTTIFTNAQTSRVLTLPDATDTLVGRATTDTLTNKTLNQPVISQIVNTGTLTLPNTTDTLVGRATTDTLTNKTIVGGTVGNDISANKIFGTSVSTTPSVGQILIATSGTNASWQSPAFTSFSGTLGVTQGGTGQSSLALNTFVVGNGVNPVQTNKAVPNGVVVGTTDVQLLQNKQIEGQNSPFVAGDTSIRIFLIPQGSSGTFTQLVSNQTANRALNLPDANDTLVARQTIETLTNKTLLQPVISVISNGGGLYNMPSGTNDNLVARNTTDTLTNKTLITPIINQIINGGTLSLPSSTDTLVGRTTTDTLTNKIIIGGSNNNNIAANAIYGININSTPPSSGQVLTATGATGASWQTLNLSSLSGTLNVSQGGTGQTSLTLNTFVVGNGVNPVQTNKAVPNGVVIGTTDTQTMTNKSMIDNSFSIIDSVDPTIRITFDASGSNNTSTSIICNQTANRAITLPNASDTLVGKNTTDIFNNKFLADTTCYFINANDSTRRLQFSVNANINTTTTITVPSTANRSIILPDASDTLVGRATTDTFFNKTIAGGSGGNDVSANKIQTITVSGTAPTAGQVLVANSGVLVSWQTPSLNSFTGPLNVALGGTGVNTLTSGNVLVGNGTSAVQTTKAAPAGDFVGTSDTQQMQNKSLQDTSTTIYDAADNTKTVRFDVGGSGNTSTTITTVQTGNRVITLPDATDTLVGLAATQTLTNKTLTQPVISQIVNTGTLTLPTATDTLVGRTTTDTLTNKALVDTTTTVVNNIDATKRIGFSTSGNNTNTTLSLISAVTANRSITFPNATDTLVGRATTDTLTNKTITGGSSGNQVAANSLYSVDISNTPPSTGQVLAAVNSTSAVWQTPTFSFVSGTAAVTQGGTGVTSLTSGNFLVGNGTGNVQTTKVAPAGVVVGTTDTQTLSAKTLTAPVISTIVNTGTLTLPATTDTIVARNTTDTLTNKTIVGGTNGNDVAANRVRNVTVSGTAPTAGQVLVATNGTAAAWSSVSPLVTHIDSIMFTRAAFSATSYTNVVSSVNPNCVYFYPGSLVRVLVSFTFAYAVGSGSTYSLRIQDVQNNLTITTITGLNSVSVANVTTTTFANLSTGFARWQFQAIRTGGSSTIRVEGAMLTFEGV